MPLNKKCAGCGIPPGQRQFIVCGNCPNRDDVSDENSKKEKNKMV